MAWIFEPDKQPVRVDGVHSERHPIGTWVSTHQGWFFKSANIGDKHWVKKEAPKHLQLEILLLGG